MRCSLRLQASAPARYVAALTQYRVEPRIRSHSSLSRDELIPLLASCVPTNAAHRVDLAHPDVVIVVEVLRTVCGIGTVDHYDELGKWNVQTLASRTDTTASRT